MTLKTQLIDEKGKAVGEQPLSEKVFGAKPYNHLMFDVVNAQIASRRAGTAKTKTRSEVRGGGAKPYRQKGTGNARMGSLRSPLLPGGGKAFGPRPRSYEQRLPKKVRAQALCVALSQAQREGKLFVFKEFKLEKPKTKAVLGLLEGLKLKKALVVDSGNEALFKSVRNLKNAKYLEVAGLNVFDVLKYGNLVLSQAAVSKLEERLGS